MGLFGDKKFEPTPLFIMDITTCHACKCLLMKSWAHKLTIVYFYENNYGKHTSVIESFCQRCKPPYDEKDLYYSGFPSVNMDKPSQIKYFKKVTKRNPFIEVTAEGEEVDNKPD